MASAVPRVVLEIGSRVTTGIGLAGKKATVSFIGETQHSTGEWIGLTYDNPDGKNDGSQGGVSYFRCKPLHGAFVKRVQVKLDKDYTATTSNSAMDSKDKLAALREKRRLREAGNATVSPATTAGSLPMKCDSSKSVGEDESGIEVENLSQKDEICARESGESDEKEAVLARQVSELSASVKGLETEKEKLLREGATMAASMESLQKQLVAARDEGMKAAAAGAGESDEKEAVLARQVSELSASVKGLETEKEKLLREGATMAASMESLQKQLATARDEIEISRKQLAEAKSLADNQTILIAGKAVISREKELEVQVNELMDSLEMLTLDKEQLVMDNELLQAQIDDMGPQESSSATAPGQLNIAEENSKLREALRRLHSQSTADKTKLEILTEKCDKDEQELLTLREYQDHTAAEVLELREIVDSAASYEAMIESLTERNLELSQSSQQLESTVRDMEEQQELSEELDQQQRGDLDVMRRELDSSKIQIYERESVIHSHELKIEELKNINEKFRRTGDLLRAEADQLRTQVTMSSAESERMLARARASATSHLVQTELRKKVQVLSSELNQSAHTINQWKASHVRMHSIFGRSPLFVVEDELCAREVSSVRCAAQASALSGSLLQYIMQKIAEGKPVVAEKRTTLSMGEDDENNSTLKPLPLISKPIEALLIRQALLLLRATCASWHCAGLVLSDYQEANMEGKLSSAVSSLHRIFETLTGALEKQKENDEDDTPYVFEEKIFIEIEKITGEVEELLRSFFAALGVTCLAWLPSFQTGRRTHSTGIDVIAEQNSVPHLSELERKARRFHISCQSSFLALGTDLLAAFVTYRVSPPMLPNTTQSPSGSPLTASTVLSPDEGEEAPKGTTLPAPHSGAISDLCRTIRSELEALGLFAPGGVLNVSSRVSATSGADESPAAEATDGRVGDMSSSIKYCLVNCFDQLLDIAITSQGQGVEDVTAFPVQLRACLSKVSQMKTLVNFQQSKKRSEERESELIPIINLSSPTDSEKLWQTLTTPSVVNEGSEKRDQTCTWDDFTCWRQRSKVQRELLLVWGSSHSELAVLQMGIKEAQRELQTRADELKAAKSANLELNSILQLSLPTSPLSCATEGRADVAPTAGSRSRKNANTESSLPGGDVAKLKAEIEVLTSALTVLEIQFEGAERENKRIRTAGRTGDSTTPSRTAVTLAEMVRVWREIASHRLMGSMVPLPAPSEAQPRSKQPDAKSVSRTVDLGFSLQDEGQTAATAGAYPEPASALSTYRELRKLRSTLRIQVNCASGIDTATKHCAGTHGTRNPPVFLGRESRTDREVLLQKFSQSILLGGGSILQ